MSGPISGDRRRARASSPFTPPTPREHGWCLIAAKRSSSRLQPREEQFSPLPPVNVTTGDQRCAGPNSGWLHAAQPSPRTEVPTLPPQEWTAVDAGKGYQRQPAALSLQFSIPDGGFAPQWLCERMSTRLSSPPMGDTSRFGNKGKLARRISEALERGLSPGDESSPSIISTIPPSRNGARHSPSGTVSASGRGR